jgi:hypothetical protein
MPPSRTNDQRKDKIVEQSDPKKNKVKLTAWPQRLQEGSFPPAAVVGAFVSFVTAASPLRSDARTKTSQDPPVHGAALQQMQKPHNFEIEYAQTSIPKTAALKRPFSNSVSGITADAKDRIYVLADGQVQIFSPQGELLRHWKAPDKAQCLAVDTEEHVYLGAGGQVEIYHANGTRIGGFAVGDTAHPATITSIKSFDREIFIADATARLIHRCDRFGKQIRSIGMHGKSQGFMLPNRSLDFAVDAAGVLFATDSGRHRVSSWHRDGTPVAQFGKFGVTHPQDFVGCCNPVNLAVAPDGKIITAEKVIARIKVYDASGKILALIGPEHFDPKCTHLHLAVDSQGRILAADPVRLQVKIFSIQNKSGDSKSL